MTVGEIIAALAEYSADMKTNIGTVAYDKSRIILCVKMGYEATGSDNPATAWRFGRRGEPVSEAVACEMKDVGDMVWLD